jgi:hypothetical protein
MEFSFFSAGRTKWTELHPHSKEIIIKRYSKGVPAFESKGETGSLGSVASL